MKFELLTLDKNLPVNHLSFQKQSIAEIRASGKKCVVLNKWELKLDNCDSITCAMLNRHVSPICVVPDNITTNNCIKRVCSRSKRVCCSEKGIT
jgi:hypothetical protein